MDRLSLGVMPQWCSTSVSNDLNGTTDITKVFSTNTAFAAINTNNKVITWGYGAYGGIAVVSLR